jgi:hypothetical protein
LSEGRVAAVVKADRIHIPNPSRSFAIVFLGILLVPVYTIGALSVALLWRSGELHDVRQMPVLQQRTGAVYGSAVHENFYAYKTSLHEVRRPRVVAMGSSRVMQFRQESFQDPFANLGGAMRNVAEGELLARDIVARHRPEVAIIGVDFWWFNPVLDHQAVFPGHTNYRPPLFQTIVMPVRWAIQGTIALPKFWQVLIGGGYHEGMPTLGILAAVGGEGYRPDGSYRLNRRGTFIEALKRVREGRGGFERAAVPDRGRVERFANIVRYLESHGVSVITFVPPLPRAVLDAMDAAGGYGYVSELRRDLFGVSHRHYDFLDPRTLASPDDEFFDGLHGGEIVYLRILQRMNQDADSPLATMVRREEVAARVGRYAGLAVIPDEAQGEGPR